MGARLDQFHLATNPDVIGLVKAAVISAAIAIRAEDPATANHAKRLVLSNTVYGELGGTGGDYIQTFAWLVAMNSTIQQAAVVDGVVHPELVADGDVDFVVASQWDAIAGPEEVPEDPPVGGASAQAE